MERPWLERRVLAYAHQGGAKEGPSSTLFAIDRALEAGATAIELDVHLSADGVVMVSHDPTVDRMTNGTGAIAELSSSALAALDAAYWFVPGVGVDHGRDPLAYPLRGLAPADFHYGMPTLAAVLERYPGVVLNLDVKNGPPAVPAYEEAVARLLAEHDRRDDVIVTSFSDGRVAAFHALAPGIGIAPGVNALTAIVQALRAKTEPPAAALEGVVALQVPDRLGSVEVVDVNLVRGAHELGIAVHVWTVDDPAAMTRLVDVGVDGIMSDVPRELAKLLAERGVAFSGPES